MSRIDDILKGYSNGKPEAFKFFAFWSPPITDEHYSWVKECGYTHLIIDQKYNAVFGSEKMAKAVSLAEKYGLKAIVAGGGFVKHDHPYADNPAFDGAHVDEPLSIGDLEMIEQDLAVFQERYPDKCLYINLVGMEGRSWEVYSKYYKERLLVKAFRRTVSGDRYALREPDENGRTMTLFVDYIRRISKLAAETNSEAYFFLQTISMHGNGWANPARRPTLEDIRFQHYVALACGVTGFQHFCYMSPGIPPYSGEFAKEDYACIHEDGSRTPIWYAVKQVIAEFKTFQNTFLKMRWQGIMPVYGATAITKCENFIDVKEYVAKHSYIREASAQEDLLIGCFEDADGNVGLVIVNFCDPYFQKENHVRLVFDCTEPIGLIKDGQVQIVQLENSCYAAILASGEGQILILPKQHEAVVEIQHKEVAAPAYLTGPESWEWKEVFNGIGWKLDTYNIYGSGNSHFEFMESGYPEGGSGRVARLYTSTTEDKDWSTFKIKLPNIPYDKNKKLVFKMYFTGSAFAVQVSCNHIVNEYKSVGTHTLERFGNWTWFEVPLKDIWPENMEELSDVTMCIGAGVPYGTIAYLDEVMLCNMNEENGK